MELFVCRWQISEVAKRPAAASAHPARYGLQNYRLRICAHRRMVQFLLGFFSIHMYINESHPIASAARTEPILGINCAAVASPTGGCLTAVRQLQLAHTCWCEVSGYQAVGRLFFF